MENWLRICTASASRKSVTLQIPMALSRLVTRGPIPQTSTTGKRLRTRSRVVVGTRSQMQTPWSWSTFLAASLASFARVLNHGLLHQLQLDTYVLVTNSVCQQYEKLATLA